MNLASRVGIWEQLTISAYRNLFDQGYEFQENCGIKYQDANVKKYEKRGKEVKVHARAFWATGYEDPEMVAIFTKRWRFLSDRKS